MYPQSKVTSNFLDIVYRSLQASAKEAEHIAVLTNTPLVRNNSAQPAIPEELLPMLQHLGSSNSNDNHNTLSIAEK